MQRQTSGRLLEILLVEDNLDDVEFAQLALKEAKMINRLHHVGDGEAALNFLKDSSKPRPDLILLDLFLPKLDGREVLQAVKQDESLQAIPVIVLTTSGLEADVHTHLKYATCYLHKPIEFSKLVRILRRFQNFWVQIVELPTAYSLSTD